MTQNEYIIKAEGAAEEAWAAWELLWESRDGKVNWTLDDVQYLKKAKKDAKETHRAILHNAYENRPAAMWDGNEETRPAWCVIAEQILPR